jgi:hypothetical protein
MMRKNSKTKFAKEHPDMENIKYNDAINWEEMTGLNIELDDKKDNITTPPSHNVFRYTILEIK